VEAEVPTLDLLNRMVADALPWACVPAGGAILPADIYFDSADWTCVDVA